MPTERLKSNVLAITCEWSHYEPHSATSRYPTPGSVSRFFGLAGSASSFRRSCAI